MAGYRIKDWNYKSYDGNLEISIVRSEEVRESEISDIVYETLQTSVIDDMIDDYYEPVDVCGNNYPASLVLKSIDALAYDDMKDDCCEMKIAEIIDELPDKPTTFQEMINQCLIYWKW